MAFHHTGYIQIKYIDNIDYQPFVVDMVEKWSDFFEG